MEVNLLPPIRTGLFRSFSFHSSLVLGVLRVGSGSLIAPAGIWNLSTNHSPDICLLFLPTLSSPHGFSEKSHEGGKLESCLLSPQGREWLIKEGLVTLWNLVHWFSAAQWNHTVSHIGSFTFFSSHI